jgi:hypothetical protein
MRSRLFYLCALVVCWAGALVPVQHPTRTRQHRILKDSLRTDSIAALHLGASEATITSALRSIGIFALSTSIFLSGHPCTAVAATAAATPLSTSASQDSQQQATTGAAFTSFLYGAVSGSVSKAAKEVVLHPIDTVKSRIQLQSSSTNRSGFIDDDPLFKDLFNGVVPSLIGGIPAAGVFFATKDYSKSFFKELNTNLLSTTPLSKETITILGVIIANIPHWIVRSPTEVLKTRAQVAVASDGTMQEDATYASPSSSSIKTIQQVWRQNGSTGLFNFFYGSFSSNYLYAVPADIVK